MNFTKETSLWHGATGPVPGLRAVTWFSHAVLGPVPGLRAVTWFSHAVLSRGSLTGSRGGALKTFFPGLEITCRVYSAGD